MKQGIRGLTILVWCAFVSAGADNPHELNLGTGVFVPFGSYTKSAGNNRMQTSPTPTGVSLDVLLDWTYKAVGIGADFKSVGWVEWPKNYDFPYVPLYGIVGLTTGLFSDDRFLIKAGSSVEGGFYCGFTYRTENIYVTMDGGIVLKKQGDNKYCYGLAIGKVWRLIK
ncbi:MAG: hypothetical protein JW863_17715 [Chitinispirillaceae bacterium]|nr:hypothetical protein [Chitinispirillaceae bacterium]